MDVILQITNLLQSAIDANQYDFIEILIKIEWF
jgi:hypothetical protein